MKMMLMVTLISLMQTSVCFITVEEQHLVRCLINISVRQFAPGRTVVLSMHSDNNVGLQITLVKHLHQTNMWPVILGPFEHKSEIMHLRACFIIYISFSCNDEGKWNIKFLTQIGGLIMSGEKYDPVWDQESLFVFVIKHDFSSTEVEAVVIQMFNLLFQFKMSNTIIIIQNNQGTFHRNGSSSNTNVSSHNSIQIYTHVPYQNSELCNAINKFSDITLLDTWIMEGNGNFIKNSNLFPKRNYRNLQRCPLRAMIKNSMRFVEIQDQNILQPFGLEILLFKLITTSMNATEDYRDVVLPSNFNKLRQLAFNKADIAFGGFRQFMGNHCFEFTKTYFSGCTRWYVPCGIKAPRAGRIFRILSISLWIVTTITLVLVAFAMVVIAKKSPGEWQTYKTVGSSLTEVWAVILGVSVSMMPCTPPLRMFLMSWVCFSLSFSTVIQSYLTTYLTDPGYERHFQNMDELLASELPLGIQQGTDCHLINRMYSMDLSGKLLECDDMLSCITWTALYRNISVMVTDIAIDDLRSVGNLTDENNKDIICGLDDGAVICSGIHMLFLKRNPLLHQINDIITRVMEAGIFNLWNELLTSATNAHQRAIGTNNLLAKYHNFSLKQMSPVFLLLLFGHCMGLIAFLMELMIHQYFPGNIL